MSLPYSRPEVVIPPSEAGVNTPEPGAFALQALLVNFAQVNRNHNIAGTERRENDAEHTLSVAYLAWYMLEACSETSLDTVKVLKYALVHDIVEVYAGDVNSFAPESARAQKELDEAKAQQQLNEEFASFTGFTEALNDYQARDDDNEEVLFVWSADKVQALIMDELDDWGAHIRIGVSYEAFCEKWQTFITQCSPYCAAMVESLVAYSIDSYRQRLSELGLHT